MEVQAQEIGGVCIIGGGIGGAACAYSLARFGDTTKIELLCDSSILGGRVKSLVVPRDLNQRSKILEDEVLKEENENESESEGGGGGAAIDDSAPTHLVNKTKTRTIELGGAIFHSVNTTMVSIFEFRFSFRVRIYFDLTFF